MNTDPVPDRSGRALFDRAHRAHSLGAILAVSAVAFAGLALTTVAPIVAEDLGGVELYGWFFSAFLSAQIVGTVVAGRRADRRRTVGPGVLRTGRIPGATRLPRNLTP